MSDTIEAQGNLQDVTSLITNMQRSKEILLHCSVFMELKAKSKKKLRELQTEIDMELARSKIKVDKLTLRQKEGFLSVNPLGTNMFGSLYERVLPASSVANMYPFNFSGKTYPNGFHIGRDKYGKMIVVIFGDFPNRCFKSRPVRLIVIQLVTLIFGEHIDHSVSKRDIWMIKQEGFYQISCIN